MSIVSSFMADAQNKWKDEIVQKLEKAVNFKDPVKGIEKVKRIIEELKNYHFTE
jgi:uncharacterized protein involved in tolerance to divalent cations